MLIIPHSAEVRHEQIPWVVLSVMTLCIVIFVAQINNEESLLDAFNPYCDALQETPFDIDTVDYMRTSDGKEHCADILLEYHYDPDPDKFTEILQEWFKEDATEEDLIKANGEIYSEKEFNEAIDLIFDHYDQARYGVPKSLNHSLYYYPDTPNPFKMITSSLSHADWWHIVFNLIFFFAFSVALEYIIANTWKFLGAMLMIALVDSLTYSLTVLFGAENLPTLGLSGIVMGMIGMSAYLMPNVRIRTFIWVLHFARNVYIPAIFLALWYIGWDIYYLFTDDGLSNTNFVAHVSGGIAGYMIARIWFKERREETRDEVDDEVEYMRSLRQDKLGILSSYKSKDRYLVNALRQEQANKAFERTMDRIHQAVGTGNDALAINLFLEPYEEYRHAIELYEQMYEEMLKWSPSRALLCLSRLLISEYIAGRKYARAIQVAQRAYAITEDFVFANEKELELLMVIAQKQGMSLQSKIMIKETRCEQNA